MTIPLDRRLHIHYPSSDGKPMADNTRQWNWITFIKNGLEETTAQQNIFVAGDLFWYPVEGNNKIRVAPDVLVAIGRPKGDKNSYLQWREAHIAPQIVFEILSPGNTKKEMAKKLLFYEKYEVIEYYVYDPDFNRLEIYHRTANKLKQIQTKDWTSPLLKFRLLWTNSTLKLYHPNGEPFLSYGESIEETKASRIVIQEVKAKIQEAKTEIQEVKARATDAKSKMIRAKAEAVEAKAEATEAKTKMTKAKAEAIEAKIEANKAKAKTALLAAKLKELGIDPNSIGS